MAKLTLCLIFLSALFLRFYHLSSYPVGLSIDEAAIGYNAYSILKTGRDEFGKIYPLYFKSLGDYKLPFQIYLTVPFIAIFSLNEFAIRVSVALLGSLTPVVVTLFLRKLKLSWTVSLFAAFSISISGWHIFLSRASFETVTALFLLLSGLLLFFKGLETRNAKFFHFSGLLLGLSLWTYHSFRIFVPLLYIFLIFQYRKKIALKYHLVFPIFLAHLVILTFFHPEIVGRINDLWLTRDPEVHNSLHQGYANFLEFIFDNNYFLIFQNWTHQYLQYFDFRFWFWKALNLTPPQYLDFGLMNLVDLPLFIAGTIVLIRSKNIFLKKLAFFWFVVAPLAASFTRGEPNHIRVLIWLPLFALILGLGFEFFVQKIHPRYLITLYIILLFFNFFYFIDLYFNNFKNFYADVWHYGYKEAVQYACQNKANYQKIIITDKYGIYWPSTKTVPHLYALVHCQIDPTKYLENREIYNLEFRQPQWRIDSLQENTLLIGSNWDFPENFPKEWINKIIFFPNSRPALLFVETAEYKIPFN